VAPFAQAIAQLQEGDFMRFIHSSKFNTESRNRVRGIETEPMETRKKLFGIRSGLAAALICGCLDWAQGMQYEPFRFCLESAKVDSSLTWVRVDDGFGVPPPYKEVRHFQYQPAGCLPGKTVGVYDYGDMPDITTYTLRPGQRVADYTRRFENGVTATGTEYYSASGKLDSSFYSEDVVDEVEGSFKFRRLKRYITKPDYELVQTFIGYDDGPLEFSQGDSIVSNDSGKTVYSRGENENRVTECVSRGKTFVCTPTQVDDEENKLKIIWFLDQGRPDSMQVFLGDGTLYYSTTYFWSSRQGVDIRARNPRAALHRSANIPKFRFDLRGRRLGSGHGAKSNRAFTIPR
jgi:hypothetical protein